MGIKSVMAGDSTSTMYAFADFGETVTFFADASTTFAYGMRVDSGTSNTVVNAVVDFQIPTVQSGFGGEYTRTRDGEVVQADLIGFCPVEHDIAVGNKVTRGGVTYQVDVMDTYVGHKALYLKKVKT